MVVSPLASAYVLAGQPDCAAPPSNRAASATLSSPTVDRTIGPRCPAAPPGRRILNPPTQARRTVSARSLSSLVCTERSRPPVDTAAPVAPVRAQRSGLVGPRAQDVPRHEKGFGAGWIPRALQPRPERSSSETQVLLQVSAVSRRARCSR